jgi:glutamate 5-kinase
MQTLQAISAAGQSRLVEAYNRELARHGLVGAQVLLDPARLRRSHASTSTPAARSIGCWSSAACRS